METSSPVAWFNRFNKIPWYVVVIIVTGVFCAGIYLVAYLEGVSFSDMLINSWRHLLVSPAIIIYIIIGHHFINRLEKQSIEATVQLVRQSREYKEEFVKNLTRRNPLHEIIAALAGIGMIVLLSQPWRYLHTAFDIYLMISQSLMFGIVFWLIYRGIIGARSINRLSREELDLDLSRLEVLTPIARWSLGETFGFIGGISISVVFQSAENLLRVQSAIVYAILVGAAVLIFFLSMRGIHNAILKVKQQELSKARERMTEAYRKLRELPATGTVDEVERVYSEVTAWWIYEKHVREVREWPYDNGILRRLVASMISPAIIYLLKLFFGIQIG